MDSFSLLFVDDEVDFLSTIKEFFSDLGYLVHTAQNGQEAFGRVNIIIRKYKAKPILFCTVPNSSAVCLGT